MNETTTTSAGTDEDRRFIRIVYEFLDWPLPSDEDEGRNIVITPYEGAYGVAGHVIAIEGSPPRGVVYVASSETAIALGSAPSRAKTFRRGDTPNSTKRLDRILKYLKHRGYEPA